MCYIIIWGLLPQKIIRKILKYPEKDPVNNKHMQK